MYGKALARQERRGLDRETGRRKIVNGANPARPMADAWTDVDTDGDGGKDRALHPYHGLGHLRCVDRQHTT